MSRPRGGFIGHNPAPAASALNSAAGGIWTLREAEALKRAGTWPTIFSGPTSVSGLQLWLDASDASTLYDATSGGSLVAADGGVARWEDKSSNARHMTQGTAGSRPARKTAVQGGLDVLRFDGSADFLSVPSSTATFKFLHSTDSTVFVVMERPAGSYAGIINTYDSGTNNVGWLLYVANGSGTNDKIVNAVGRAVSGQSTIANDTGNGFLGSGFSVISAVCKPADGTAANRSALRVNGGTAATNNAATNTPSTANSTNDLTIGRDNYTPSQTYTDADYCEIIIYNSALSDTDREAVENYLMTKWGIS